MSARNLARRLLGRRRLMLRELANKVLLGRSAVALRRAEDAEVARLEAIQKVPHALVATIVPTYRRPEQLRSALRSALAQTITDHVVLVVDDGAGLPDLPADPRLWACSLSANTAVAGVVRNVGIRLTSSTYVAFLDDDNEWEPNHLEVSLGELERRGPGRDRGPDLVYTALRRSLPDGRPLDVLSTPFDRRRLAADSYLDTNAMVIRRFDGLHFSRINRPREVRPREDWELAWRLSRRRRVTHIPVPTVRYQVNPDSHWSNWAQLLAEPPAGGDTR